MFVLLYRTDVCGCCTKIWLFDLLNCGLLLTFCAKNGKVIKINAMTKTSKRTYLSFRELPFGARQQENAGPYHLGAAHRKPLGW